MIPIIIYRELCYNSKHTWALMSVVEYSHMAYQGWEQKHVWRLRTRSKEPGVPRCVPLAKSATFLPHSSQSLLWTKGLSTGFCGDCCWHCSRPVIGTMTLWGLIQIPAEASQIRCVLFVLGLLHECPMPVTERGGRGNGSLLWVTLFWARWSRPTFWDSQGSILVYWLFPRHAQWRGFPLCPSPHVLHFKGKRLKKKLRDLSKSWHRESSF